MSLRISQRSISLVVLILGSMLLSAPVAGASCAEPLAIEEAIAEAPAVFVGVVVKTEHDGRLASFAVDEVWKGDVEARVLVSGGPKPSELEGLGFGESIVTSVDRTFEVGSTYLVVPFGIEERVYMDNGCSVTQLHDSSLDEFRPATVHPPIDVAVDTEILIARIAVGLVVIAGATALVVATMRRGRLGPADGVSDVSSVAEPQL